jgi:hypothetical protein
MSYSISFVKTTDDDPFVELYQDRITNDVWFTRLNSGGPLFNYKYYVDNSITPTQNILRDDFWYDDSPNSQGGTIGVKWAILSSTGFPDLAAPGINSNLFGTIGNPTNFFSFSQMCVLLKAMIDESSKPISLTDPNNDNEWVLEDSNTYDNVEMPYLENKDLGCYIPAINKYFKINISLWGIGEGNAGAISYTRTELIDSANICFPAGTPIQTDQGIIAIEKINPAIHTIRKKPIVDITKTITADKYLVRFKKNALGLNYPTNNTLMSKEHKVYYQGKMCEAKTFLDKFENVVKVKYTGEILYNVLMEDYSKIRVNNLMCETLHPDNIIAKLYTKKCKYTDDVRDKIVVLLKECEQKKDYKTYNTIVQRC